METIRIQGYEMSRREEMKLICFRYLTLFHLMMMILPITSSLPISPSFNKEISSLEAKVSINTASLREVDEKGEEFGHISHNFSIYDPFLGLLQSIQSHDSLQKSVLLQNSSSQNRQRSDSREQHGQQLLTDFNSANPSSVSPISPTSTTVSPHQSRIFSPSLLRNNLHTNRSIGFKSSNSKHPNKPSLLLRGKNIAEDTSMPSYITKEYISLGIPYRGSSRISSSHGLQKSSFDKKEEITASDKLLSDTSPPYTVPSQKSLNPFILPKHNQKDIDSRLTRDKRIQKSDSSNIPTIANEELERLESQQPQPRIMVGSSGIISLTSNQNHLGRDKKRTFLRSYKLLGFRIGGRRGPELPHHRRRPIPDDHDNRNTHYYPGYHRMEEYDDGDLGDLPNDEVTYIHGPSENSNLSKISMKSPNYFSDKQTRNESLNVMRVENEKTTVEDEEDSREEGEQEEEGPFERPMNKEKNINPFSSGRIFTNYGKNENFDNADGEGEEERMGLTYEDTTNMANINSGNENQEDSITNETSMDPHMKVNLEKLEEELSKNDEDAASDLLLAISILKHHMVPNFQHVYNKLSPTSKGKNISSQVINGHTGLMNDPYSIDPSGPINIDQNKKTKIHQHSFNIEMFDGMSSSTSTEDEGETDNEGRDNLLRIDDRVDKIAVDKSNESKTFQFAHDEVPRQPRHRHSCYKWFVLVLDGNCSVIKQRMTTFVTFLKAALSSKIKVDYEDIYVPSVFCDNSFMVNITLDTNKNPDAENKLRNLAEANTTLLEIAEEIFYLEKILMKRSGEEGQNMQPLIKKPDDVDLVIYIAVGCMCAFILLSVVIVALIRLCRQEGDQLDIGKTLPPPHPPRPFDFPIRRPNVIYSHRFSQDLTPDKCSSADDDTSTSVQQRIETSKYAHGTNTIGVKAVNGSVRGSILRNDTQYSEELMVGDDDYYSVGSPCVDDHYNDRRPLVPSRRRTTKVPGEEVILEEDIVEEEEEDLDEDDDDGNDEVDEDDLEDPVEKSDRNPHPDIRLDEEGEDYHNIVNDDDSEQCHFHRSDVMKKNSSSQDGSVGNGIDTSIITSSDGLSEENVHSTAGKGSTYTTSSETKNINKIKSRVIRHTNLDADRGGKERALSTSKLTKDDKNGTESRTIPTSKERTHNGEGSMGSTDIGFVSDGTKYPKGLLGSHLRRGRRNLLRKGNQIVFTGIDNPCYNR